MEKIRVLYLKFPLGILRPSVFKNIYFNSQNELTVKMFYKYALDAKTLIIIQEFCNIEAFLRYNFYNVLLLD